MRYGYQFQLDYRPAGPIRTSWYEAVWDAVAAGYAQWDGPEAARLDSTQGATIERLPCKPLHSAIMS